MTCTCLARKICKVSVDCRVDSLQWSIVVRECLHVAQEPPPPAPLPPDIAWGEAANNLKYHTS